MARIYETTVIAIFWASAALVVYAYLGYPILIWIMSRLFGSPRAPAAVGEDAALPTVSLVIAAYNEETVIGDRIRNALKLDYPRGKFEVLVGSDGSKDRTAAIVREFTDPRVRLFDFAQNRGKASVLNELVAEATGDLVLPSDANTMNKPDAARKLVRWFADPKIGAVCGRLVLTDAAGGRNADGAYWKYETFLKRCEGRLGALLGANGAIYAIRRDLYQPISPATIVDDFVIPLLAKLHHDCAIVYDCEAIAYEETAPDVYAEFHRRARIGAGGFQSIGMLGNLLHPKHGWAAFTFVSHKVLRWLCPFFMIAAMVSSALLWRHPLYRGFALLQLAFYAISAVMLVVPPQIAVLKPLRLTTMFTSMNAALLVGFWRWLLGLQKGAWLRTPRVAVKVDHVRH